VNLRPKLLGPLLLVSASAGTYLYGVWSPTAMRQAEEAQLGLIARHVDSVGEALVAPLLSGQLAMIHDTLGALRKKNREWRDVRLVNESGQQLYPLLGAEVTPAGPELKTLMAPVALLDMRLGTLTVVVDMAPFLEPVRARYRTLLLVQMGILLLVTLTAGLVLELAVIRPARRLAQASRELAERHFDTPLPEAHGDEIGALVSSFATMRRDLKAHHAELLHEIDERKEAQERLRQHQAHLEDQVRLRTAELEAARDVAEAANSAKSVFLANMSHELRTPLNAVLGFSELMSRDADATPGQRERLDIINRSGQHLLGMINDVLDLSKIEVGSQKVEVETLDIERLVDDLAVMFRLRTEEKGLDFRLERANDVPSHVTTDAGKLRQILINLLGNAVKFTAAGGIVLRLRAKSDAAAYRLLFEVEDTGRGIPQADLDRVFEPFVQLAQSNESQAGSGLGLTISRRLARLMGGELTVASHVGKGSVFTLEIPAGRATALEAAPPSDSRVCGLADGEPRWRLLVVDDKIENRQLMRALLEPMGFEVRDVASGAASLEMVEQWHPHLVWMDMRMPGMDGYEATRRIRTLPGAAGIKVVALTASAFAEQRGAILAAGCDDVVHKPFRAAEIFAALERHLGVHYRYEASGALPPTVDLDWSALPEPLAAEVCRAAALLDLEAIEKAIARVAEVQPALANGIASLARDYRFDQILQRCRPATVTTHE
jgi:signal transduction histidine kinase/ActR/RegA family two-component response regulator